MIPVKLLLVDDLDENLLALEALLRREDIVVLKARSGTDALELLLAHDVALALVDVQMPEMDGFELAEMMRGIERTRSVPIIFVTAGAREPARIFQGYDAGAVDFLFKPIDPHILRHKVDTFVALHRQRQQLAEQVEIIRASEELRRRIIESSEDLIAVVDKAGLVTSLNAKGKELSGGTRGFASTRWSALWENVDDAARAFDRATSGESARFQSGGGLSDLRGAFWDVVVSPIRDARGRVDKVLGVARDVSELHRLNDQLVETLRLNETFVAAIGHDLRTPLNNVVMSAEILHGRATPGDQRVIERMRTSALRMSRMIDELFDLARARLSGGIPVSPGDDVDLKLISEKIIAELAPGSGGRVIEIEFGGDTCGAWDADRMGQVLANLLGNALRHGTRDVPVRLSLDGTPIDEVVLTVSNGGQIPEEVLSCLFQPFRRGTTRRGSVEGLGLGLFIVEQIVNAHGGQVTAASSDDVTRFQVVLPRRPGPLAEPAANPPPCDELDFK